jgi:hypothetical protein
VFPVTDVVPKYTEPADGFAKVERVEGPVPQVLSQDKHNSRFCRMACLEEDGRADHLRLCLVPGPPRSRKCPPRLDPYRLHRASYHRAVPLGHIETSTVDPAMVEDCAALQGRGTKVGTGPALMQQVCHSVEGPA